MTREQKRQMKKQEIIDIMTQYKDENGGIDLSALRKEDNKTYNKISYYFGSIDNALAECGVMNVVPSNSSDKGASLSRKTLRNELAYDMIATLRKNHTLEEIAQRYGCTRAHVNQLFKSLAVATGKGYEDEVEVELGESQNFVQ